VLYFEALKIFAPIILPTKTKTANKRQIITVVLVENLRPLKVPMLKVLTLLTFTSLTVFTAENRLPILPITKAVTVTTAIKK
jgi:hypothetical protein